MKSPSRAQPLQVDTALPALNAPSTPRRSPVSRGPSLTAVAFISSTLVASRHALAAAKPLLAGRCQQLTLVNCLQGSISCDGMAAALSTLAASIVAETGVVTKTDVFKLREGLTLEESLADYVKVNRPGLVIISYNQPAGLPSTDLMTMRHAGQGGAPATEPVNKPFHQMRAIQLVQEMASVAVPVLLISGDARPKNGFRPWSALRATSNKPALNCLLEVQPTSRDVLDYLLGILEPGTDKLYLSCTSAFERPGVMKLSSRRIMAGFSVQATIGQFTPVQLPLAGTLQTALPPIIQEEHIDLVALQGPRTKELSPSLVSLLTCSTINTNFLIWPPAAECSLRPHTSGNMGATSPTSPGGSYAAPSYTGVYTIGGQPLTPTRHSNVMVRPLHMFPDARPPKHLALTSTTPRLRSISDETGGYTPYRALFR